MRIFILLLCFWATAPLAQTFPLYEETTVNDYADLLVPDAEAALASELDELRTDTGVEMTVLTLDSQRPFSSNQSLEAFATALFDNWGIGDADRNDGVLVMVLRADRAMRIELGAAYGQNWNREAQYVVDNVFLPEFRNEDYATGIVNGVDAVISEIVLPFQSGVELPPRQAENRGKLNILYWIFGGLVAFVVSSVFGAKRLIKRMRKCPQCGQGGLNKDRIVDFRPSYSSTGAGRNRFHCSHCDYEDFVRFTIAQRTRSSSSSSSSSSFGGGRSGGGGASGRW